MKLWTVLLMHFVILIDNQAYAIEENNSALNWHSVHTSIMKVNPLFADVSPMPLSVSR